MFLSESIILKFLGPPRSDLDNKLTKEEAEPHKGEKEKRLITTRTEENNLIGNDL